MQRSGIREANNVETPQVSPDFISLHPSYETALSGLSDLSQRIALLAGALLVCASMLASHALADDFSQQVWLNPGVLSHHFQRDRNLREDNAGFGAEVVLAREHAIMAGTFINSERERSRYAGYLWRALHWQLSGVDVNAGIAVAAFDGYPRMRDGGWFAVPLPLLSIEGRYLGANLTVVPTIGDRLHGAIAVQFKLRVG